MTEKAMDYLEAQIPEMAVMALKQAYWDALASGNSVLISEDGKLLEVFPDGTRKFVKKIEPWVKVVKGERLIHIK